MLTIFTTLKLLGKYRDSHQTRRWPKKSTSMYKKKLNFKTRSQ